MPLMLCVYLLTFEAVLFLKEEVTSKVTCCDNMFEIVLLQNKYFESSI